MAESVILRFDGNIAPNTGRDVVERAYRQYWTDLCQYVRRNFGVGPPEPEDIAQETFARFAALENVQTIDNPWGFLRLTAHNLVIDAHRKLGRGNVILRDIRVITIKREVSSAEDVLLSKEQLQRVERIVAALKPKQRVAFLLHRVDGLRYSEIAKRMGVSEAGARLLVEKAFAICMNKMKAIR